MNPAYFAKIYAQSPSSNQTQSKTKQTSIKKCIKRYDEVELEICDKIKKIPRYFCYFAPILKYNFVQAPEKYIVSYQEDLIPFNIFFQKINVNERKMHIQSSYLHIVKAFQLLRNNNIFYGNYGKIGFNQQNQPILFDFTRNNVNLQYFPLEMHVIDFLERESCSSLSQTNIETIVQTQTFSKEMMNLPVFLVAMINIPKQKIIDALCKYRYTWDNYALSILYLEFNENDRLSSFTDVLVQTLATDPEKRPSHEDILLMLS